MEIFALNIDDDIPDEEFHSMMERVSRERKTKILKFRRKADAKRALYSELLIRRLIGERLPLSEEEIRFETNQFGKPLLKQAEANFHFNISHSGSWVVCVLDSMPVGIDVEEIKPIDFDLAKRFFSQDEVSELHLTPKESKLSKFYSLWTLKESYIKAIGKGLSIPLDSFSILTDSNNHPVLVENHKSTYFFRHYDFDPGYKLSVCAKHDSFPEQVVKIEFVTIKK
jgi:4'-phosphopantetheinyl transferase